MAVQLRDIIKMLMALGVTEYEAKVYAALLSSGSCTVKEISFKSDVPRTKIYPTLKSLERRGMILFLPEEPVKCKALPPDIALASKVSQMEETLRRIRRALNELKKAYESYKITEDLERQELWVLKRDQAVQNKLATMIREASEEVFFVLGEGGVDVLSSCKEQVRDASFNDVKLIGYTCSVKENLLQLRDLGAFIKLQYLGLQTKYSLCVADETDILVFWSEVQGTAEQLPTTVGVFAGNFDLSSFIKHTFSLEAHKNGIDIEAITPLVEGELVSILNSQMDGSDGKGDSAFSILVSVLGSQIEPEKLRPALIDAGRKALTYLAGRGFLDTSSQDIESNLRILSSWITIFDKAHVKFKFDGLLKMLTCEVSGALPPSYEIAARERLEVFPSIWGLALVGALEGFGYDSLVMKNLYDEKRHTWIIQRKLTRKGEIAAEA